MSHKIKAKIILDSIAPSGARLVTFEVVVPRFLCAMPVIEDITESITQSS